MGELRRVGAIIIKDKKILLVKSGSQSFFNIPGAAPRDQESSEIALKRGLMEELNIQALKMKFFNTFFGESKEDRNLYILDTYLVIPDFLPDLGSDANEIKWANSKDVGKIEIHFLVKDQIIPELKRLRAID